MSNALPEITVAAGIIRNRDGHFCLSRRPAHKHQGGLWEFPGGKLEPGETPHDALARELHEELGLTVAASAPFMTVAHRYPDRRVVLHFREATDWRGEPCGREGQAVQWVSPEALRERDFPAANRPVALALQLPAELVIVPEGLDEAAVLAGLNGLAPQRQGVYLRHWSPHPALPRLAARCRERGLRFWLRDDASLAARGGAFGLHLSRAALARDDAGASRFPGILSAACHDQAQIERALARGCHMAMLSPVQATPTHPQAPALGWARFHELVHEKPLVFYALGGLGPRHLLQARAHGGYGVAGIRAFWPAPARR